MASEQLVKHCAESVNIRGARDARVISHRLFRRHVTGSAQNFHRVRNSAFCFHQPGQPEIGEMRFAFCIEQNVAGFDVSMKDAVFMRVVNRARQFCDEFRCIACRDRRALCHFIELSAVDEFHAEVAGTLAFAHFVNRNDAWMIQVGGGFGFPAKAL